MQCSIERLFITPDHQYKGFYGGPPGHSPMVEKREIQCRAGRGIVGDRYFDYKPNYKGQITFFSAEVFESLLDRLNLDRQTHPARVRRNVITRGIDLNELIGETFTIQGISFQGSEECSPCFWMDQALKEGAHEALKGVGGLRARIRSDGVLKPTD